MLRRSKITSRRTARVRCNSIVQCHLLSNKTVADRDYSTLLTHLYSYFSLLLECSGGDSQPSYSAFTGDTSMYDVHKFMTLDAYEVQYFIEQVGLSAASFGVEATDVVAVGQALQKLFGYRCSPPTQVVPDKPNELQSICIEVSVFYNAYNSYSSRLTSLLERLSAVSELYMCCLRKGYESEEQDQHRASFVDSQLNGAASSDERSCYPDWGVSLHDWTFGGCYWFLVCIVWAGRDQKLQPSSMLLRLSTLIYEHSGYLSRWFCPIQTMVTTGCHCTTLILFLTCSHHSRLILSSKPTSS